MTFQLIYYSQQDPKWKGEILGFGEAGDTIGYVGCALTSTAMLLSGHGYTETPKTLNQKLKDAGGFAGAGIRWGTVSQIHPQVIVKSNVSCVNTDAPLSQIDASLAAGQPVIVMVDSTPATGLLTHWVLLYAKEGDDYLMLDPWPYHTDAKKKILLMPRYSQGNPLRRSIMHVIIYECITASGGVATPAGMSSSTGAKPPATPARSKPHARVKADVTWGLNIRSGVDTSSTENVLVVVPAGTLLTIMDPDGMAKVGAVNQFIRVRAPHGQEGLAAAWYLEKVDLIAPPPASGPSPARTTTASGSPAATTSSGDVKLIVVVKSAGAKVYKTASNKSEVLSKEKGGAKLVVVEPAEDAIKKIGMAGKWLTVKGTNGKRGFADGGLVKEG